MMHYYGGYGYGYDPAFGFLHLLGAIIVIAFIIFVIMLIFRGPRRWQRWSSHSALSTLNDRYAKGEIDTKEYEERKKALLG